MRKYLIILISIAFACDNTESPELEPEVIAEAEIFSLQSLENDTYEVTTNKVGIATFSQTGDVVTLEISLTGMTPNSSKAIHIHNGTVEDPGRHWNSGSFVASCNERSLGQVWARPFIGDVGNIPIDASGNGTFVLQTDLWAINSGDEKDVLNKPIIVHEGPQDFIEECNPMHDHNHGHSNPKIGGGTVTLISDVPVVESSAIVMDKYPDFTICK